MTPRTCRALLLLLLAASGLAAEIPAGADRVESLPGYGDVDWLHAGYLNVDPEKQRELYYMLVASNATDAPVLLWMQGGPGCSAVGVGWAREFGPLFFEQGRNLSDPALEENPYAWSSVANLLFLDTPAFTGFSRSADNVTDRFWDDANTTAINLAAVLAFYQKFPELRGRPLYLAGQSYAGHYAPLLAEAIVEYNADAPKGQEQIPLAGYAVGNPWTDPALDNAGAIEAWYGNGFISRGTYDGLKKHCDPAKIALWRTEGESGVEGECATYRDAALEEAGGYFLYGTNAPLCLTGPDGKPLEDQPVPRDPPNPFYDPCAGRRAAAWFNRQDVQEAINAIKPGEAARPWKDCDARAITYDVNSLLTSMLPVHRRMIDEGLRVWIYSGDTDGVVPPLSTRSWVESLGLPPAGDMRPWVVDAASGTDNHEAAGYVTPYKGLTFATMHEAGHGAPYFQPEAALTLISSFLNDEPLPERKARAQLARE